MKTVYVKQYWKGFFTYVEGYYEDEQLHEVEFHLEITLNDNSFTGFQTDSESEHVFDKPASVKGFVEGDKMSFVLNYPCSYFKDETGTIVLDRSSEHPDIHYLGILNKDRTTVVGNWEMTLREERHGDGYLEEISNGRFEMKKIR